MKRIVSLFLVIAMMALCVPAMADSARYDLYCGMAAGASNGVPVAAWVKFNPETHRIQDVYISGQLNPAVSGLLPDEDVAEYINMQAEEVTAGSSLVSKAVKDACDRYLAGAAFTIRPYQTMAVDRYIANNPHFDTLTGDAFVEVSIVAAYPEGCVTVVTEDVPYNDKISYPAGVSSATFTYGENTYTVSHNAVLAHEPGVAVIAYTFNGETVLDAVEVFENFTLYPEALSGSDSYGKVVASSISDDTAIYITLGDKAMNFPGGTAGSTLCWVIIDREARTIINVTDFASSDSTYLVNEWEYGGAYAATGDSLFAIGSFTELFNGRSADELITKYTLTSTKNNIVGGVPVDGGIDMVVTGATRTPNAIISAVNAALEAFAADCPAA